MNAPATTAPEMLVVLGITFVATPGVGLYRAIVGDSRLTLAHETTRWLASQTSTRDPGVSVYVHSWGDTPEAAIRGLAEKHVQAAELAARMSTALNEVTR